MNWWQKLQHWVTTGEGIAAVGASAIALAVTIRKFGGAIRRGFKRIAALFRFLFSIDKKHDEIVERLNGLDRGQLDLIQTRGHLMDADERAAFWRSNAQGQCVWVSELWRSWTGLSGDEALSDGWELGILETERARVWQNWHLAVTRNHRYEDTVTYCNRHTGQQIKARVIGNPVRGNDGKVLSWNGIAKPL